MIDEIREQDGFAPEEKPLPEIQKAAPAQPRPVRPEPVLGLLAVLSLLILILTLVLCLPYMAPQETEDPALALAQTETTVPAQTEEPTVPPTTEETLPSIEPVIHPEANPYGRLDFQYDRRNFLYCLRQPSYTGVDVSGIQGDIDWQEVKDSGIRFAMLRLGYRGYETGKLVEDKKIRQNLRGTKNVDMPIGAYFFSQALTIQEVDEEIEFMLKVLGDRELEMPIVLDWEIPAANARTAQMDARTLTAMQEYFCKTMTEKGYTPMVYFNWHQSSTLLYLNELEDYPFWLALYTNRMTYPYHVEMWQYTCTGRVPGIYGDVDINVYMPKAYMVQPAENG